MTVTVSHSKTNSIADWTQADVDAQIAAGTLPPGTLLANIVLPSDWNANHTISGLGNSAGLDVGTTAGTVAAGDHNHAGVYQPASANLDEYAAVNPTAAGLALLDDADNTAQRTTLGLGDSATKNVGTAAGTVAAGDHTHAYAAESFKTISVSGQSDVVADSATDTLTLASGTCISITTNATTDTITAAVSGTIANFNTACTDADFAILGANTFTGQQTFAETKETVYTITDGAAFEIDPVNGNEQIIVLGANRTPKGTNFEAGQSVVLHVDDGTAYTITWTDSTFGTGGVTWVGGSAPTLATSGYTVVVLWKVGTKVYGKLIGNVA